MSPPVVLRVAVCLAGLTGALPAPAATQESPRSASHLWI